MFALVNKSNNSITKMYTGRKGITIDDNQYKAIFSLWSESERNVIEYILLRWTTNKKSERWYINTDITYTFDGSKVTGSYGTATAREHV